MHNKIHDLYCDIANYLIQKIDASDYTADESIDAFLNRIDPDMFALYCAIDSYLHRGEDK